MLGLEPEAQPLPVRQIGKAHRIEDARGRYIEFCKATFGGELSLKGLKIVVDAAHGAAYQVAPDVFHELGADVEVHFARLIEVAQILRGDGGDGDVADVDLLLANEVEQQVERPVIAVEVNVERR